MARSSSYSDMIRNANPFDNRGNSWRSRAREIASNFANNRWNQNMMDSGYGNNYNRGFSFTTFGTGLLLGVGIALLLAPKSGRELRDDLSRRAGSIGENVRNRLPQINNEQNDRYGAQNQNVTSAS